MRELFINSTFALPHTRYPFSRLLSKIKSVVGKGVDISSFKNLLEQLYPYYFRGIGVKLGVIMTSSPFESYDLTLTCFYANSKKYRAVYRCTVGSDGKKLTTGQASKIEA